MQKFKTWEELSEKEQLLTTYSDFYKDVYGYRPRFNSDNITLDDLKIRMQNLSDEAEHIWAEEKEFQQDSIIAFEEYVSNVITTCNCDRKTALRYIMDADKADNDFEYLCFLNNLPYGYFKEI